MCQTPRGSFALFAVGALALVGCIAPAASPQGIPPFQTRAVQHTKEPPWVSTFEVGVTSGLPAGRCAGTAELRSAGVVRTGTPVPDPEPANATHLDLTTFPTVGLRSGAASQTTDPRLVVRSTHPVELAALPVERLRGLPADIDRVRLALLAGTYGKSAVRVGFWGASHVAGEFFTGPIRRVLQQRFGDGGHGFVMPVGPWKGYRADGVSFCSGGSWVTDFDRRVGGRGDGQLGPGGMSVESGDPSAWGWVQTGLADDIRRIEVLFLRQRHGGTLRIQIDDAVPIELSTLGAPGPGAAVLRVKRGPHRVTLSPKGDGVVRLFGVNLESGAPGFVIDAMGVNGRTASSWQRWDEAQFTAFEQRRPHQLIVLAYGTNEANDENFRTEDYRKSLEASLQRVRSIFPETACILIGPGDRAKQVGEDRFAVWDPNTQVAAVQRAVGPQFGCATWDLQGAMGGPGSALSWWQASPSLMSDDLIHLSPAGYGELARRLLAELDGGSDRL